MPDTYPINPALFLHEGADDTSEFIVLRLRGGIAAVCGPYSAWIGSPPGAHHSRAAQYYRHIQGVFSVKTTCHPVFPSRGPDQSFIVWAKHPDGRRALVGPFVSRKQANNVMLQLADGLGGEFDQWDVHLEDIHHPSKRALDWLQRQLVVSA
ncbi:MAG: hypothetical protein ACTHNU_09360 [Gaiellales bacterium]